MTLLRLNQLNEQTVDIRDAVSELRKQRVNMVQTVVGDRFNIQFTMVATIRQWSVVQKVYKAIYQIFQLLQKVFKSSGTRDIELARDKKLL